MFGKKKDIKGTDNNASEDGSSVAKEISSAPPLKPFSRKGSHAPSKPPTATTFQPEIKRRNPEIPGGLSHRQGSQPNNISRESATNRLVIGREIQLSGEITACEKLVVEGSVQVTLSHAHSIEVTPSGHFAGSADVEEAYISGRYDGDLVAREKLVVKEGGHVKGKVRYGRIVIESGGEVSGDMQALEKNDSDI